MKKHVNSVRFIKHHFLALSFSFFFLFPVEIIPVAAIADSAQYSGIVVDPRGFPVDKATVRLQGTSFSALTDATGFFKIRSDKAVGAKQITAWKEGYYNGGTAMPAAGTECSLLITPIPREDNTAYAWLPALATTLPDGQTETKPCQQCHAELTEQWRRSSHANSAINPLFLAFFDGTDGNGTPGAGPSYKLDFPNSNGNCATCHVPAMALKNPFNSDPREARGVEKEGVSCDLCHKIDQAGVDSGGGHPGTLSLRLRRPAEGHQLFYGPYDDVFPGEDSYHPIYRESRYCAPCHHGKFWNVLMYSEFSEWAASTYARNNVHCQDCHMGADGSQTHFAPEKEGGVERRPETIPTHGFNGVQDRALMTAAIDLGLEVELKEDDLRVTATIKNLKAGHHYPTGNPMRHMILLVEARGEDGGTLALVGGERVPAWGGKGPVEQGNYAGFPGKGFAKVLRETTSYPDGRGRRHFQPEYPAPHWRPALIESDNRIPANGADISQFNFHVPAELRGSIRVMGRLLFRRSYKKWLDSKGLATNDLELACQSQVIGR